MNGLLLVLGGGVLLAIGAELLVRGASRLALSFGIAPLVVGLTVVAFGTSTPELAASIAAQVGGKPEIALANIVGSNIANVGLILALAGLLLPLPVQAITIRREIPILGLTTLVFSGILYRSGAIGRVEGGVLLAGLVALTFYQVKTAFQERPVVKEEFAEAVEPKARGWPLWLCGIAIVAGLALLAIGGDVLVKGAILLAQRLGMSERVIGLTIVAVGTSMPELAASIVAVIRKETDVAVGNVIGSNLFNILGIGGSIALVAPVAAPAGILSFDVPVLLGTTLLVSVFLWTKRTFSRAEGAVLLAGYAAYVVAVVR